MKPKLSSSQLGMLLRPNKGTASGASFDHSGYRLTEWEQLTVGLTQSVENSLCGADDDFRTEPN